MAACQHRHCVLPHRDRGAAPAGKPGSAFQNRLSRARRWPMADSYYGCDAPLMKQSKLLLQTYREAPRDADVVSQQLMMRAGMIQKLAAGIYDYLPLALRSIRKVENIVREELNRDG